LSEIKVMHMYNEEPEGSFEDSLILHFEF